MLKQDDETEGAEVITLFAADDETDAITEPAPGDIWQEGAYSREFIETVTKYPEERDGRQALIRWPDGPTHRRTDGVECARYSTARSVSTMPMDSWLAWCSKPTTRLLVRGRTPRSIERARANYLRRCHGIARITQDSVTFIDGTVIKTRRVGSAFELNVEAFAGAGYEPLKAQDIHSHHGEPRGLGPAFWLWMGMRMGVERAPEVAGMLKHTSRRRGLIQLRGDAGDDD